MTSGASGGRPFGRFPEPDRPVPPPGPTRPGPQVRQQYQPFGRSDAGADFTTPVELRCILQPTSEMRRMIPLLVFTFLFAALVIAVIVGIIVPDVAAVSFVAGLVGGAVVAGSMYMRLKVRLTRTFGELQRLRLMPHGMQRTDGTIAIDMPWATVSRIEVRNSALPSSRRANLARAGAAGGVANGVLAAAQTKVAAGIVGRATLTPLPGASRARLKAHDRVSGGRAHLRRGQSHTTEQGLIFPGEFEAGWVHGTVGAWLRHYRPDLQLPN
ncbi:hypothetical protein [Gordonia sp. MP11Mi]